MFEKYLSVQDTILFVAGLGILLKIYQLWKEGKFK